LQFAILESIFFTPMRIFIYEFACAEPEQNPLARDLRQEGLAILSAVAEDFSLLPGIEVLCLSSHQVAEHLPPGVIAHFAENTKDQFDNLARVADFTLVIAPESNGTLLDLCSRVERAGGQLVGTATHSLALVTDKLRLAERLKATGVPAPVTIPLPTRGQFHDLQFPVVIKPRRGAGSQDCHLLHSGSQLGKCLASLQARYRMDDLVLQPYVAGRSASVSFLAGGRDYISLLPATQEIQIGGRIRYLGGRIPIKAELCDRAVALARRAVDQIRGLSGYFGVDLVLGEPADGSQDRVIEVNARLTTSYIGLRALAKNNLADAMLQVALGKKMPETDWRSGAVRFWPDGRVQRY
jgi:predicted ATP-grasp superfamily ATP-dependent carboligase